MSRITHLSALTHLNSFIASKTGKLVVLDFHAKWCSPCHAIAPKFEALSNEYRGSAFAKVDVDAATDIAAQYSIRAMPTFVFLKDGKKVDEIRGANAPAIEAALKKYGTRNEAV